MITIIDNKKVNMTSEEYTMYQAICRSYDRQNFQGEEMFKDLFETDDNGIIIFLKPPSTRSTSVEVFLFLIALFQHQHTRLMYDKVAELCKTMEEKIKKIDERLDQNA